MRQHELHQTMTVIADRTARDLLAKLKSGEIASINITTIRSALAEQTDFLDDYESDRLENMTTRRVVDLSP